MTTLVLNTQKCLYAKATYLLKGILPSSVIWDYINSTPASSPIWLEKSDRFSEAFNTKITDLSWRRACREKGITDKKTLIIGNKYKPNIQNFFFRVELDIVPQMVDSIWDSFMYTCKSIIREGHKNKVKNFTRDCEYCSYKDICYVECTNGNRKYLVEKNFKHRGDK
jgi:hypothetical protein